MPKGIPKVSPEVSPYDRRHGFSKDLIELCNNWNLGHPKKSPNPNKDALEFNLISDVILSDYAELRKTVVGLRIPDVAEIRQKIQTCVQKIRRVQSGAHAKENATRKEQMKKKRVEENGVAGSAYETHKKKSKISRKNLRDEQKGVAGSPYDNSLKEKVKDRALAIRCASPASRQVISLNPRSPSGSPLSHLYQPQ